MKKITVKALKVLQTETVKALDKKRQSRNELLRSNKTLLDTLDICVKSLLIAEETMDVFFEMKGVSKEDIEKIKDVIDAPMRKGEGVSA